MYISGAWLKSCGTVANLVGHPELQLVKFVSSLEFVCHAMFSTF